MTDASDYSRDTELQLRMPKDGRQLLISRSRSPRQIKWSEDSEWLEVHLKFESVMGDAIEFYAAKDGPDARALRDLLNHKLKKGMV